MRKSRTLEIMTIRASIAAILSGLSLSAYAVADSPRVIHIPAGDLVTALETIAKQADVELLFSPAQLQGLHTAGLDGTMTSQEAVKKLLEGTPLQLRTDASNGAMMIGPTPSSRPSANDEAKGSEPKTSSYDSTLRSSAHLAQSDTRSSANEARSDSNTRVRTEVRSEERSSDPDFAPSRGVPEVLVKGSKILNMDLPRSRDDAQPYVVMDRDAIQRSAATTLDDFLKKQLPMNAVATSIGQDPASTTGGGRSTFNLRGLGADQTLVLVDGRRLPLAFGNGSLQADTSGIPLAAIERIEVLPTTAAGIYGGSATGGVINIIMRRDYTGSEVGLTYEDTFDSDVAQRRVDFSSGLSLEGGRTNAMLSFSHSDANELFRKDRDFDARGLQRVLANNGGKISAIDLYQFYPPLGATTNIKSADGSNLVLKNGTALGSTVTYVPTGYAGVGTDAGAALLANAGQYNTALSQSASYTWGAGDTSLLKLPRTDSLMASVRREFTPSFQMFLDASYSRVRNDTTSSALSGFFSVPAGAAANPFTNTIYVTAPLLDPHPVGEVRDQMTRVASGLIFNLPHKWLGEADYTWGRSVHSFRAPGTSLPTLRTAVTAGTIDVFRDFTQSEPDLTSYVDPSYYFTTTPYVNRSDDIAVRVSGPLFALPGGDLMLSGLLEHRRDRAEESTFTSSRVNYLVPPRSQEVNSAYAELRAPIVSAANRIPAVMGLELQLAVRTDHYVTEGAPTNIALGATTPVVTRAKNTLSSTNPTIGLRYQPLPDVALRASYSTGFQPPNFTQLTSSFSTNINGIGIADPKRGGTFVGLFDGTSGGNPALRPEESSSRSLGVVLTPRVIPDLRMSVDWFRINKSDNIARLSQTIIVANEDMLPDRVVRGPKLPGDPPEWAGPIIRIDQSYVNISKAKLEGYDLRLDYTKRTEAFGTWSVFGAGTYQTHFITQLVPGLPEVENIGTGASTMDTHPLEWRANAGLTWSARGLTLGWTAQYYDSFLVADSSDPSRAWQIASQGNGGRVPSQVFHDVMASYDFSAAGRGGMRGAILDGLQVRGGVKNVFNTRPAFYVDFNQGLLYNPYGDPRLAVYYVSIKKAF